MDSNQPDDVEKLLTEEQRQIYHMGIIANNVLWWFVHIFVPGLILVGIVDSVTDSLPHAWSLIPAIFMIASLIIVCVRPKWLRSVLARRAKNDQSV